MARKKSEAVPTPAAASPSVAGRVPDPAPAATATTPAPREGTRPTARPSSLLDTRVIYCGDNLEQLRKLPDACVDLIYIDPPFNSNRNYEVFWGETKEKRAFEDRHESTKAYIEYMRPRCDEMARVLKKTGSFYYHCDWHASHYVKVMLDQIFGENCFRCEIIWKRTFAHGNVGRNYGNIADSIFFYTRSDDYCWNQPWEQLTPEEIEEKYPNQDANGRRWQSVTLRNPGVRPNLHYPYTASNGVTYQPHPNGWSCNLERMKKYDTEGRLHFPTKPDGALRLKMYADESQGERLQNIWLDVSPIGANAAERLGYPTQKPIALLERIIQTSSNENDIVLDAFCGCGTALVAAQKLKRQWIGIDVSPTACRVMAKRLKDKNVCGMREDEDLWAIGRGFIVRDIPLTEEKLRAYPPFEFENWAVIALGGRKNKTQVGDKGIDGRIFPVTALDNVREAGADELALQEHFYAMQVKQKDKTGRPDIDSFETAMRRAKCEKGFFVSFDYSSDAMHEIDRFFREEHRIIIPLTVREILDEEIARKLA